MTHLKATPRQEFARPDWERNNWLSLNGIWQFELDEETKEIVVPFSWSSPLSGVSLDKTGVAHYTKKIQWKPTQEGAKVFICFGAVDYTCKLWVNDQFIGSHDGGYGYFDFDIGKYWDNEKENTLVVQATDLDNVNQTRGKQGYGEIRGIWQPVWLEERSQSFVKYANFITKLNGQIDVEYCVYSDVVNQGELTFCFADEEVRHNVTIELQEGFNIQKTTFHIANPKHWSPDSPYLYEGTVSLCIKGELTIDYVSTYFGIREINSGKVGSRDYRWILLNNKPIYLNGALDQSYNSEGFFTYPTDQDMKDEILRLKRLGLNFVRIHIKPEEPRKLYWADKLGILVMEDMPCFWGDPSSEVQKAFTEEVKEIIQRDFNHPSIFSWVIFNETWGLRTDSNYLLETQEWVRDMFHMVKKLDPTRLVEDNSPCNNDHVETDINSWHFYKNGYEPLKELINEVDNNTFQGSKWNYIGDNVQSDAPLLNSECGAVWGIDGSAGDSDIAWHYHYMMNEYRKHDKLCGFVFTELNDVTNEFNGYYRIDYSEKDFGYEWFCDGMSIRDLHSSDFIVIDMAPCTTIEAGQVIEVPLTGSSFSDKYHNQKLNICWKLCYHNLETKVIFNQGTEEIVWDGYGVKSLTNLTLTMPECDSVAVLSIILTHGSDIITRNFTTFDVRNTEQTKYDLPGKCISIPPAQFINSKWEHLWTAHNENKLCCGRIGAMEYEIILPLDEDFKNIHNLELYFEASSKRLLDKDIETTSSISSVYDFMQGDKHYPGKNPNSYFMTDEKKHRSIVDILIDGEKIETIWLADDPADSRGVLSWHYQELDTRLEEAGSYGFLFKVRIPIKNLYKLINNGKLTLKFEAHDQLDDSMGGFALYGRNSGRYPVDILLNYW